MTQVKRALLILLVLSSCVGCDQVTKAVAREHLPVTQPLRLLGDGVRLQYTENSGAFLSLGARLPDSARFWLLVIFTSALLVGMAHVALSSPEMTFASLLGLALVISGGFSNLLDRLFNNGAVVDFMNLGIGSVRTGIFNLADVAIMAGLGILVVWNVSRGTVQDHTGA